MEYLNKMQYHKLTDYLISVLPKAYQNNFYSWIDSAEMLNEGRNVTVDYIELMHLQYDTTFYFEDLPFRQIKPVEIMAHIQTWLYENDPERYQLELANPQCTIELIDDKVATVEFSISFQEKITAQESENGDLTLNGKKYQLGNVEIYYAKEFEIIPKRIE
ncbi:phage tail protein [Pasteurella skyensis]|uniref:Phage tail protein n=1 Tax=Phocoenobacter skyensis TaxID=97481 RepID=A0AAJ6NBE0_9PAST|nr:phage tail protein [Pasteurella skyensis]MDP8173675.1 phage tail protein [Pasteurella skyensis]MDP8178043.1 phage tail protein [Pasteurella skyensis]